MATETRAGGPTAPGPVLEGRQVRLRPTVPADATRLAEILAQPEVSHWWHGFDTARVEREMIAPDDGTMVLAIDVDGAVAGLIQYAEEDEPDYRHAGIDLFLDAGHAGRGLGADALRTLARHLFTERGHHRLTIDPAAANERAILAYGRVGFRPVGIMRRYERGADGTWHNGLLMDLMDDELT